MKHSGNGSRQRSTDDFPASFCPRFWNELSIRNDGTIAPCCATGKSIQHNGRDVLIDQTDPDEPLANLPHLQELRRNSVRGIKSDFCQACYDAEANGGMSTRKWALKSVMSRAGGVPATKILDDYKKMLGEHTDVHIVFGNLCNFRCRMCKPQNSTRIAADPVQSGLLPKLASRGAGLPNPRNAAWFNDMDVFRRQILPRLKSVRTLNITAGEPLMIPMVRKLLAEEIDDDTARNCILHITTNGSICDNAILESLARFKAHNIVVSIDGVGKTCEYIRNGAKWDHVLANARRFAANGARLRYTVAIQAYNILALPKIDAFLREEDIECGFGWVVTPWFLNPSQLPKSIKIDCIAALTAYVDQLAEDGRHSVMINHAINRLKTSPNARNEAASFKAFCKYTTELDHDRGEQLATGAPELYELLSARDDFRQYYEAEESASSTKLLTG